MSTVFHHKPQYTDVTPGSVRLGLRLFCLQVRAGRWTEQLKGYTRSLASDQPLAGYALHPCRIAGQPTLVHAPELAQRDAGFYAELVRFADRHGYVLLADRRRRDVAVARDRRQRWLPVLMLCVGASAPALADSRDRSAETVTQQTLGLYRSHEAETVESDNPSPQSAAEGAGHEAVLEAVPEALVAEVGDILREHYSASAAEPAFIQEDLTAMAAYFARYPQAVELLRELRGHSWQLQYADETFETEVRGNRIQVQGATVKFDTRSAAQLRRHKSCASARGACVASPADALLHELLHVETALLNPREFIQQGGLNGVMYPFAHENAVIRKENALYESMSALDGAYRPSRHSHSGRVVASACVTCLN